MSDILKDFGTHLCSGPPGCRICRLLSECEELRAAICNRFKLVTIAGATDFDDRGPSRQPPAVYATILRVLKEKEQRNDST